MYSAKLQQPPLEQHAIDRAFKRSSSSQARTLGPVAGIDKIKMSRAFSRFLQNVLATKCLNKVPLRHPPTPAVRLEKSARTAQTAYFPTSFWPLCRDLLFPRPRRLTGRPSASPGQGVVVTHIQPRRNHAVTHEPAGLGTVLGSSASFRRKYFAFRTHARNKYGDHIGI